MSWVQGEHSDQETMCAYVPLSDVYDKATQQNSS